MNVPSLVCLCGHSGTNIYYLNKSLQKLPYISRSNSGRPKEPAWMEVTNMAENKNEPVKSFRQGNASCNVFLNVFEVDKEKKKRFSFSISNAFTRDDGKTWEYNNTFNLNSLSKLRNVLQQAEDWSYTDEAKKLLE